MKVYYNYLSEKVNQPVVTVGFFDGVHLGHQALLNQLKCRANEIGGESIVITLWPHPKVIIGASDAEFRFLTSLEEKLSLLEKAGIDHALVINFDKDFASLSAKEFIQQVLVDDIHTQYLLMGFDNYFGRDRQGDFNVIKTIANDLGFKAEKFKELADETGKISSSAIRHALANGKIEKANMMLGFNYFMQGTVEKGKQLGRTIGFPTANIKLFEPQKLVPLEGVYAITFEVENMLLKGMLNIGFRPTLGETKPLRTIEANLFDFDGDLYDKKVMLNFAARIRAEQKFNGLDALKEQIRLDKLEAQRILS